MANKLNRDQTISALVARLDKPSSSRNWSVLFWFSWVSCLSLMSVLTYIAAALVPNDIHLPQDLRNFAFWSESGLWFLLAITSGAIAYISGFPGRSFARQLKIAYTVSILLGAVLLFRESPSAMAGDFLNEIHLHRGPCGFFILVTGLFSSLGMFFILKRAAPTDLPFTALWTALSVGSLSSMFMHLVCTHESTAHSLLWHVTPVLVLMGWASVISPRLLRW